MIFFCQNVNDNDGWNLSCFASLAKINIYDYTKTKIKLITRKLQIPTIDFLWKMHILPCCSWFMWFNVCSVLFCRFMEPAVIAMLGGVLPFGSIFIEMYVCIDIYIFRDVYWSLGVSCVQIIKTNLGCVLMSLWLSIIRLVDILLKCSPEPLKLCYKITWNNCYFYPLIISQLLYLL